MTLHWLVRLIRAAHSPASPDPCQQAACLSHPFREAVLSQSGTPESWFDFELIIAAGMCVEASCGFSEGKPHWCGTCAACPWSNFQLCIGELSQGKSSMCRWIKSHMLLLHSVSLSIRGQRSFDADEDDFNDGIQDRSKLGAFSVSGRLIKQSIMVSPQV